MAGNRDKLAGLLDKQRPKSTLKKGAGFRLSTEPTEEASEQIEPQAGNLEIRKSRNQEISQNKPKRVKLGYAIREDLIKAYKRIALEEDRHSYEVMEEALEEYLARHRQSKS